MNTEVHQPAATAAAEHLPDDPALLKEMIRELLATLAGERHQRATLERKLEQLLRRLYGPRNETVDADQLPLFAGLTEPAGAPPVPAGEVAAEETATAPRRKGHGRRPLPKDLPRERKVYDVPVAERACPGCGAERTKIGEEVSEQLDYQPATLRVIEHVRPKYACPHCQEHVTITSLPARPIEKGLPAPGLLAHVVVSKYADHLPLYRQEGMFARQGVELSRKTLCDWMAVSAQLLEPIYQEMIRRVKQSRVIHTDDTRVPVQDEVGKTKSGRLWTYIGDRNHPYVVFDYTADHSRAGPQQFLDGYQGFLHADAFRGYDGIYLESNGAIVEVACWAHTRRKFYDERDKDPPRAHQALAFIRQLYAIEHEAKDWEAKHTDGAWDDDKRLSLRREKAVGVLEAFHAWLTEQLPQVLPKSPIAQAIAYALNNWEALCRYTTAGFLAIDNNVAERMVKQVVIGRKNWLFAGSDNGGRTAAVLFSLTVSCKTLRLDPFAYLRDVLDRVNTHPALRLRELLPDRWQQLRQAAASVPS